MKRFVLRFLGMGDAPFEDLDRISTQKGVRVLDRSPRMVLVEGREPQVHNLAESLPGWMSTPEQIVNVPSTKLTTGIKTPRRKK